MKDAIPFLDVERREPAYRPVAERLKDYREVAVLREEAQSQAQASRCLTCGLPFCQWSCPLGNEVPIWNRHLAEGNWEEAFRALQATNNLPEVTARVCPALCEPACVLGISWDAVTVRENELAIIERAFQHGVVRPHPPRHRTGKSVAVVGSGPAGLSCADQLNQAGHQVVVFERDDKIGGLLRYGIPDFKLEKWVLDRRLAIWQAEGIAVRTGVEVGVTYPVSRLRHDVDAVCLAGGSRVPRDLPIEGRGLRGIHVALDYLAQSNRRVAGERIPASERIDAGGRQVVVIGGGDTGADCVGTAHRQGAARVVQLEILPRPPERRRPTDLWPDYPAILRTSSSHEEGGERDWAVLTKAFLGANGSVESLSCVRVEWTQPDPTSRPVMRERPGTEFHVDADLVLLALGFVSPERHGWLDALGVRFDARGNVQTDQRSMTSVDGVFSTGDMRRGQSLVVHAISDGRNAAHHIDRYLMGSSSLPVR
ncbi:MAG: glutamate synthase subunit beta [Candidatus Omnitrophica bacterium]|nr:glutamate synthase subunit beta [Candidatus Omnitrophota bacterium]